MKRYMVMAILAALLMSSTAFAIEKQAFMLAEDFGQEPLYDGVLQYYYYIPCPTYSWFWAFSGWNRYDMLGEWFQIGDLSTGGYGVCDPVQCHTLEQFRILDFAGYGTVHPGLFTIKFDIYCSDSYGCPVGPSTWTSGPLETGYGWNYFEVDPPLSICPCAIDAGPPASAPRVLLTVTHVGPEGFYPAWGFDNIGTQVSEGCVMHDIGCLPALYPRPYVSHYAAVHSGFYGRDFEYCPPQLFADKDDATQGATEYGFVELAWRLYLICSGPSETAPTTWGNIKSMYR
jgi:hypothetical protein